MGNVKFEVNGEMRELKLDSKVNLLYVLREKLGLTGAKCGCDTKDCGACMVIVDGEAVRSCAVDPEKLEGHKVLTIEGLSHGETLHPIQEAFIEVGAVQCGYCTPGMIMSAKALLDKNANPTETEVRNAIDGNLCRCTGYEKIVAAILLAGKRMEAGKNE